MYVVCIVVTAYHILHYISYVCMYDVVYMRIPTTGVHTAEDSVILRYIYSAAAVDYYYYYSSSIIIIARYTDCHRITTTRQSGDSGQRLRRGYRGNNLFVVSALHNMMMMIWLDLFIYIFSLP